MGSFVDTPFSLSSLLCHEQDETTFIFQEDDENDTNPCFLLDDEEEYIDYLFKQETRFGSLSYDDYDDDVDSSKSLFWFRNARLHAIDWIFNVSFHKTNQNLFFLMTLFFLHCFFIESCYFFYSDTSKIWIHISNSLFINHLF
jgi:hypothetical protein